MHKSSIDNNIEGIGKVSKVPKASDIFAVVIPELREKQIIHWWVLPE